MPKRKEQEHPQQDKGEAKPEQIKKTVESGMKIVRH